MSDTSIMTVREMIDTAFGENEDNICIVHFKLIQTILYILARQLRLLERRVGLVAPLLVPSASSLSIREVKLKAKVRKRRKIIPGGGGGAAGVKRFVDKRGKSPAIKSIDKTLTESSTTKTSTEQSSSSKTTTTKTTETSTKTSTDQTKTSSDGTKTSSDPTKTLSDQTKTTSDQTKSSSDRTKTTSDQTKSSSDRTKSSSDRTKTTTDTSSSKTSSDPTKTTTTSSTKTSSDPTKTTTDMSLKTTTETSSKSKSSTEPSSSLKTSTEKSSSSRTKTSSKSTSSGDKGKILSQEFFRELQTYEEQREREIRTIHQRADSHEEGITTPTPMASVDSMVERVPSHEARSSRERKKESSQISVVTQEQFENLAKSVREIQNKFGATGGADFPDNIELMQELRRGASLTDAMAALQLSARLEAAERTLQQMTSLVTDLAVRKGVNLDALEQKTDKQAHKADTKQKATKQPKSPKAATSVQASKALSTLAISLPDKLEEVETVADPTVDTNLDMELKQSKIKNLIKPEDLENALKELYDGILKAVNNITSKTTANADNALKTATKLEGKLDAALNLGDRMNDIEDIVSRYVEAINIMDTNLSSQMTNYQEQLTQMQHDLESGLEAMAEAMANTGGDTVAVAELNAHFTDLQVDFDNTNTRQKELRDYQDSLALDLQALLKQIELLRETKSDRDEVADALRDKAGLGALNGLVTLQQFNAVRGDFEKRIGAAYDKFNNQEIIWQKAIDDLLRELHEKADIVQVIHLRDDVNNNLEKLRKRIHAMLEIVGEPRAAAVSRQLFRDTNCISCSTPAHMNMEETILPVLPGFTKPSKRPPTVGSEDESKPKESGDYICYPGLPIRHAIDERAHTCRRYCGGSHTTVSNALPRAPAGMIISTMPQSTATALGSDGKVYKVDDIEVRKPCTPCNQRNMKIPEPSEADTAPREDSDMMPWDFQDFPRVETAADVTPPPPSDLID
ncbi:unnamed protein product [Leptosia nina]|uniref:DUF4795 domain-containing protein n=1 Tax=Leptosia nina TaxID=320188 RepID=A0AAV1JW18_9NEOP